MSGIVFNQLQVQPCQKNDEILEKHDFLAGTLLIISNWFHIQLN